MRISDWSSDVCSSDLGDDRFIAIATAGNLSVTQSTLAKMEEGISNPETGEHETLWTVPSVFRAVQLVGRILRATRDEATRGLHADEGIAFGATMLLGGRVGGEALRLYMICAAAQAIAATPETHYDRNNAESGNTSVL